MFNKKLKLENEELKKEIEKKDRIITEYETEIKRHKNDIEKLKQDLKSPLPKGCKKGDYCSACIYGKEQLVGGLFSSLSLHYVCTKDCCKEFVRNGEK